MSKKSKPVQQGTVHHRLNRYYLLVPNQDIPKAKALGAEYDYLVRRWYAPHGINWQPLSQWKWREQSIEERKTEALKKYDAAHAWQFPRSPVPLEFLSPEEMREIELASLQK